MTFRVCWDLVLTCSLKFAIAFLISLKSSVGIAKAAAAVPDFRFSLNWEDIKFCFDVDFVLEYS